MTRKQDYDREYHRRRWAEASPEERASKAAYKRTWRQTRPPTAAQQEVKATYDREYHQRPERVEASRERNARRKQENQALVARAKDAPCADCGRQYMPCAMDLHHRDPATKKFDLAQCNTRSVKSIEDEIAKCTLLFAVCHRIRHHLQRQEAV